MPATYDRQGISFQYPDNWELDEGEPFAERNSVTVFSPGGAFWALMIYPPDDDLDERMDDIIKALRGEDPEMDVETATERLAERDLVGFDLNFFYMDLTNTAIIRSWRTPQGSFVALWQAEDREYAEIEEVFRAITISLLWSQGAPRLAERGRGSGVRDRGMSRER